MRTRHTQRRVGLTNYNSNSLPSILHYYNKSCNTVQPENRTTPVQIRRACMCTDTHITTTLPHVTETKIQETTTLIPGTGIHQVVVLDPVMAKRQVNKHYTKNINILMLQVLLHHPSAL